MKTYTKILFVTLSTVLLLSSCNGWLDISPKSSLKKEDLFKTEGGYLNVLNGVYIGMVNDRLYGQELTYGFMDVLAQYYNNIPSTPLHKYANASKYKYEEAATKGIITNIWNSMYNNIANCNVILDNIDADKEIFTDNNYNRVKGEALALRAFMHFDLLRMFAPAYNTATKNLSGIPYVDKFTNIRIPFSSIDAVCIRIKQDLIAARDLLKEFDLMGPVDETVDASLSYTVADRKAWFNYYAATALLARLNLYMGDKVAALGYVDEITTDHAKTKISWSQQTQFYYYFYSRERIFGVFIVLDPYMKSKVTDYFDIATANNNNILKVSIQRTMELYETSSGGASDWRYLDWMSKTDDNYITKFNTLSGIPVLKLAEIYLIGAECTMVSDPVKSLSYLNTIRTNRGLPALQSNANLSDEIHKEYVKEFLGEGQLFYFYKRNSYGNIPYWGTPVDNKEYVFPVPDKEMEFNN